MLFSLTNPEIAIMMMGLFLFAVLLGFPIAFTLMAMANQVTEEKTLVIQKKAHCWHTVKKTSVGHFP